METKTQTQQTVKTATAQSQLKDGGDFERLINQPSKPMEYVPFGGSDPIRLTVGIVQKLIATRTKRGETCSQEDAMRFMMMCQARRLNPFEGDAHLNGYDTQDGPKFSLITAHQAFLKRAEVHPEFEGMESGIVVLIDGVPTDRKGDFHLPDENVVGGWACVHRKDKIPTYRRLRRAVFDTGFARWKIDPAGMISKCAEADALRSTFPTLVGGLYTEGEIKIDLSPSQLANANFAPHRTDKKNLVSVVEAEPTQDADEADAGLAPEPAVKTGPPEVTPEVTPQVQLSDLVTNAGFTFSDLQTFGEESGCLPDASSLSGFRDIKTADAQRLLKARKGLLDGLAKVKGAA